MTLCELLIYLDRESGYPVLDGDCEETIKKALAGSHKDVLAGQIVAAMAASVDATTPAVPILRAQATTALGPLRLKAMRDDVSGHDLKRMERTVHAIDGAFNDEALAARKS